MNDDASTYEIPDYIISRLQPMIQLELPTREEELDILKYNLPFAPKEILTLTLNFLQKSHNAHFEHSIRDGINISRYAIKMHEYAPMNKKLPWQQVFTKAVEQILGKDALEMKKKASQINPKNLKNFAFLEDFFTSEKDWSEEEDQEET